MSQTTDTLINKANEMLIGIINAATQAADFIKGEIPKVIQEMITYYSVYYGLLTAVGVALLIIWIVMTLKVYRYNVKTNWGEEGIVVFMGFWGALGSIPGAVLFLSNVGDFLKVTLAPRLWLLEYAANLVK